MASAKDPCPICSSTLTSVVIGVEDRTVTMLSCNDCDRRWWVVDGEHVDPLAVFARKSA